MAAFDREFRAGLGYHQPASALAACGMMAAGTGYTASKYVARRETPVFIAENCTQCMECIAACPDTALPNTAQDITVVLETAARNYIDDPSERQKLLDLVPSIETHTREAMLKVAKEKAKVSFSTLVSNALEALNGHLDIDTRNQFIETLESLPLAYGKTNQIFATKERREPGSGGLFSIFVSDLCKGCGECVTECGDHEALKMVAETEEVNAEHASAVAFAALLPETPSKYLGLYDTDHPENSKAAALRNHLMVRKNYEALVSGDGACAGCGEKSVLRAIASVTESYMRPMFERRGEANARKSRKTLGRGQPATPGISRAGSGWVRKP